MGSSSNSSGTSSGESTGSGGDARLTELQRKFNAALPRRLQTVDDGLAALKPGPWSETDAEALRAEVHSLAGSAGFFGFEGLGVAASQFEGLLIASLKRPVLAESDLEAFREAAAQLHQASLPPAA